MDRIIAVVMSSVPLQIAAVFLVALLFCLMRMRTVTPDAPSSWNFIKAAAWRVRVLRNPQLLNSRGQFYRKWALRSTVGYFVAAAVGLLLLSPLVSH